MSGSAPRSRRAVRRFAHRRREVCGHCPPAAYGAHPALLRRENRTLRGRGVRAVVASRLHGCEAKGGWRRCGASFRDDHDVLPVVTATAVRASRTCPQSSTRRSTAPRIGTFVQTAAGGSESRFARDVEVGARTADGEVPTSCVQARPTWWMRREQHTECRASVTSWTAWRGDITVPMTCSSRGTRTWRCSCSRSRQAVAASTARAGTG